MKDLIEYILKNITTQPDDVKVEESREDDIDVYTISVNAEDMGRVIGKSGKVIHSIRTLVRVAAVRLQKRVRVNLIDTDPPATQDPQAPSESAESAPTEESATEQVEPPVDKAIKTPSQAVEAEPETAAKEPEPEVSGEVAPEDAKPE